MKKYLHDYYDLFIDKIVDKNDYLYTISYAYASFAYNESKIFKALFMSELAGSRTIDEVLSSSWNLDTIASIPKEYSLTYEQARKLYRDVRFYTHGLSCQIACKSIVVTDEEIKKLIRNMIIAHRFSTILNCDKIFFIENGKIIDSGTHKELLNRCSEYKLLYESEIKNGE